MERRPDLSWLKDWRLRIFGGVCIFAGFLAGMLIFGSPWHLPPAWGDIPTWITAIATVLLAVFAIVTAYYARQAFLKQSEEVSDQAKMLKVQSDQLEEQRTINALQAKDLEESLKERARLRRIAEREQADDVGFSYRKHEAGTPCRHTTGSPLAGGPASRTKLLMPAASKRRPAARCSLTTSWLSISVNPLLIAAVAVVVSWRAGRCRRLRGYRGMSGRGLRSGERFVGQVGRGRVVLDVAADGACVRPAVDVADEP